MIKQLVSWVLHFFEPHKQPEPKVIEIIDLHVSNGETVMFLTARDYKSYFVTLQWLSKIGFAKANLVMVSNPSEKIKILMAA